MSDAFYSESACAWLSRATRKPLPSRVVEFDEWAKMPLAREYARKPYVGELVVLRSRGSMRLARVTKVGRDRITTEYTTESALQYAARYNTTPTVTRKPVRLDDNWLHIAGSDAFVALS